MAPKRKRSPARPSQIPDDIEACVHRALETLQKQAREGTISAQDIQSQLLDPLQLRDEQLKEEILQQHSFKTKDKNMIETLLPRIWNSYQQQQRAQTVFSLLDEAGKGVVVLQDLQRVAQEMLGDDTVNDEDLEEMIREFDQTGDGLLYPQDFVRIARLVGLSE